MAESLIAAQYQVVAQRTHQLERSLAGRADAPSEPRPAKPAPAAKPRSRSRASGTASRWNAEGHP